MTAFATLGFWICLQTQPLFAEQTQKEPIKPPVVQESERDILSSKTPVLVDFWADWCVPCRITSPIVDRVDKAFGRKLRVVRVEADKNPKLSKAFNVQYLPTLVLIQNGKVVRRWEGEVSEKSLKAEIDRALDLKKQSARPG